MTCTFRILIDGREWLRRDGVDPTLPGLGEILKASIRDLLLHNRRVAVTAIVAGVEHVIYSGRSA